MTVYFPNEAAAERAAEYWHTKAEKVLQGKGTLKFRIISAHMYLSKAVDCYTKRLDWLESNASSYYPEY